MTDEPEYIETFDPSHAGPSEPTVAGFRIVQRLGAGGMGEVFEAEQTEPVRRRVALKVIKRGMDSEQVLARFESERQAIALMDHANIAHVFDVGTTEDGRPFFAMENVRGLPITTYCNKVRMDAAGRIELFLQVCEGVQHAHQKGIIHRDLKPSNVLVGLQDDRPVPKIIDFGVAKAISQRLTERTMFTQLGQLMGTPEYMSPEQAEMGRLDVDTRTDVYSLGVLLYELLTGELPFPSDDLREAGFDGFRRKLMEEEPPRPSTRITRSGEKKRERARERNIDPPALVRLLVGDLDWITMKALDKDRTRRYASASELAADLRRYLRNEPVLASPPGRLYRAKKFVRRHRPGTAFAATITVVLIIFAFTMAVQRNRIARERDRASLALETANQVRGYLVSMFEGVDPDERLGRAISARELLDRGVEKIERLEEQPLVQAELKHTLARIYSSNGLFERGDQLAREALETRIAELGGDDLLVAETLDLLGGIAYRRREHERARRYYERALEIRRSTLGSQDPATLATMNNLANLLLVLGERDRALDLHSEVLRIREAQRPQDDVLLAKSLNNMAYLNQIGGDTATARRLYERALALLERAYGKEHTAVALTAHALADLDVFEGDDAAARPIYERVLAARKKILGADHVDVAWTLLPLAELLYRDGETALAEEHHRRAREILAATGSADSARALYHEACFEALRGAAADALAHLDRAATQPDFEPDWLLSPSLASLRDDPELARIRSAVSSR